MVSVCRFCARWAEGLVMVDDILLDNLLDAKDAIKQMFGFDLSCVPPIPNQVCQECVQYLHSSYVFRQQLQNAENVFLTLQERGELAQRMSETQNAGVALHFEEMVEDEPVFDLSQNDAQGNVESLDNEAIGERLDGEINDAADEKDSLGHVIQISIEAIEELEITSSPLESVQETINDVSPSLSAINNNSVVKYEDLNLAPAIVSQHSSNNIKQERVHESYRSPMVEAVPPAHTSNGAADRNKCYVCYRDHETEAELMAHLIQHNNLLPYRCQECSTDENAFEFRTNQALNKHLASHWNPFKCTQCPLRFTKESNVLEHIRVAHLHKWLHVCKQCGIKFHQLWKYRLHMVAHRNVQTERIQTIRSSKPHLQCAHCNRVFKYPYNYKMHQKFHQKPENFFRCTEQICECYFDTYRQWRRHMTTHFPNGMIPYHFEILPESLQDITVYPIACPKPACPYVAPAIQQMYAHYYVHLNVVDCRRCNRQYRDVTTLRYHMELCRDEARRSHS